MFERLIHKLREMASHAESFDPSCFVDPVALQTEWTPARGGGASFRTHRLVRADTERLEFKATKGALLFCLVFFAAGAVVLAAFVPSVLRLEFFTSDLSAFIPASIGFLFMAVGAGLAYFGTAPIVFDKRRGYFWKGRKAPDEVFDRASLRHWAELDRIHALQIVSEHIRSDDRSYHSYELNLVLADGRRINVVDHGKGDRLREDAVLLADFLGCPIWDKTRPPDFAPAESGRLDFTENAADA